MAVTQHRISSLQITTATFSLRAAATCTQHTSGTRMCLDGIINKKKKIKAQKFILETVSATIAEAGKDS